jgi:hypothetical protein
MLELAKDAFPPIASAAEVHSHGLRMAFGLEGPGGYFWVSLNLIQNALHVRMQ